MGSWLFAVQRFESLYDLTVQLPPSCRLQAVVEGVPDEDMGEAPASGRSRDVCDNALSNRLGEQLDERLVIELTQVRERVEIELAAEHRGQAQDAVALLRQVAQAATDHLGHVRRDGKLGRGLVQT